MMEEQAREELELLEAQYPNQYEYLKHELKSFIFELESKHPENNHFNTASLAFIDTEGFFFTFFYYFFVVVELIDMVFEMFLASM